MRRIINKPEKAQPSLAEYGRTENLVEDCQHKAPKFSGPNNITKIFMLSCCKFESFSLHNYEPWCAIYILKCLRHKLLLRIFSLKRYNHITLLYQFFFPKIFPFTPNFVLIGIKAFQLHRAKEYLPRGKGLTLQNIGTNVRSSASKGWEVTQLFLTNYRVKQCKITTIPHTFVS